MIAEDGTRKGGRQGHGHDLTGSSLADEDDNGNKDPKSTPCRSDGKGQSCGYEKDDGWNQFHRQMALLNEHADEFSCAKIALTERSNGPSEGQDDVGGYHGVDAGCNVAHEILERQELSRNKHDKGKDKGHKTAKNKGR